MSMTLYQLAEEYQRALDNITVDEETGEVRGFEVIEALDEQYDQKAINCALYAKGLNAEIDAIAAEEAALNKRRKAAKAKLDKLKQYIGICMDTAGKDVIQDPRARLSFRNTTSVDITNVDALPADYRTVVMDVKPDKTALGKLLRQGIAVPGAQLIRSRSLQIK